MTDRAQKQYRIGDYARYMGVTPDFLKYYEQLGLIKAETRENGYRYYPFPESSRLMECMKLRNYNLPTRDMSAMLDDADAADVAKRLDEQTEKIKKRMVFEQLLVEEQERFSLWLRGMQGKKTDWRVEDGQDMLFLPHTRQREFIEDERIYELLNTWMSAMPMVRPCRECEGTPQCKQEANANCCWGLSIPAATAERLELPVNDVVKRISPRRVLRFSFSDVALSGDIDWYQELSLLLQKTGLKQTAPQYSVSLLSAHMNGRHQRYGCILVPVE